ncbi:MAG: helix-turn-helix domain-containing protein, partial [Gaiellaceae bacterium]
MKTQERELARQLRRREGLSVKKIARRLRVSQSSVSLWVRDIELTPTQQDALMNAAYKRQQQGRETAIANRRRERIAYQEHGRELARRGACCIGLRETKREIRLDCRTPILSCCGS